MIAQRDHHFVQCDIAGTLAHSIDGHVHAVCACDGGLERIGGAQAVIVVPVKIEVASGKFLDDSSNELAHLRGRQQPQRIRQHDAFDRHSAERLDVLVDVIDAADHPARPVFEVYVERDPVLRPVLDGFVNVVYVLLMRLAQLLAAVMQRSLGQ
jgi:hypothetical protein